MPEPVTLELLAKQNDLILLQVQEMRREQREFQAQLIAINDQLRLFIKRMC